MCPCAVVILKILLNLFEAPRGAGAVNARKMIRLWVNRAVMVVVRRLARAVRLGHTMGCYDSNLR